VFIGRKMASAEACCPCWPTKNTQFVGAGLATYMTPDWPILPQAKQKGHGRGCKREKRAKMAQKLNNTSTVAGFIVGLLALISPRCP
jgi:hypothetical protein